MKSAIVVSHVPTLGTLRLRSGQAMGHPAIKFIRTKAPKMYDR